MRLQFHFGAEGIGVYWMTIEMLSLEDKRGFKIDLDAHPIEVIAKDFSVDPVKLVEMYKLMSSVGLIEYSPNSLSCKALQERAGDYTKRVWRNSRKTVRSKTGQSTVNNQNLTDKNRIEQNRIDKNRKEEMLRIWNATQLPQIISWSKEREIKLAERFKSEHFQQNWKEAIIKLSQSEFATGNGPSGWKADINWFLNNDTNYLKVLEGKYDGKPQDRFAKY